LNLDFDFDDSASRPNGKIEGVMIGIVTNNEDPEGLSRVKLTFPLREANNETDWVRVATLMAGKDRGSLFIPEVGDEVLVAFHLGEMSEPYVIGALWNDKDPSPKGHEKNHIRKFRSRAGHEIMFNDDDADGQIILKTKKGHKVEIGDKQDLITVADSSGVNTMTIQGGSKNEITIKSQTQTVKINAKGEIEVSSVKSLTLKSVQVNVEATGTMTLKAGAMLDIKSDGMINIKGSMVKIN